jgi:ribosomal protein L40E
MDDSPRKPRWWLIATAAVLAVLTLYYYTGSWVSVLLVFAALGTFVAYQTTRGRKPLSHACVRCGAKLNPNARQCSSCGSASWTIH